MYKLQGHTLNRGVWFEPESQGLVLQERGSTTTITLGPDAPVIEFDDWIYDEESPDGPYVWRVKSIQENTQTSTVTVELEHPINLLSDLQIFGEVTTSDISGGDNCWASEAVAYLLDGNADWILGAFEVDNECPYEFETVSVYDAIKSVTDTLEGVYWDYDLSQHPFVLSIRALDMNPSCEMREGRNLSTMRRSVSRSGMYTRLYPIGENDLHLSEEYIEKNVNLYGRIDKVQTDSTKTTEANLRTWAEGLLAHNSEPDVSITISGLELSQATGEPMDRLRLNRFCRCPLPEYGTTIIEKITKLQWRDRIKEPESVTVTLANNTEDITEIVKSEKASSSGGSGAAGQAKQNYLFQANGDHLYYEVFDECGHLHGLLEVTSESLRTQFNNTINSTRSELLQTSESLRITFENEIQCTRSQFEMTSESLRIQFENDIASTRSEFEMTSESLRISFENEIASTRSEFQMTSESLRIEFQNSDASLRSAIQQEAGRISLVVEGTGSDASVRTAAIVAAVTDSNGVLSSSITVDAEKVYIGNEKSTTVIAGKLSASDITAEFLNTQVGLIPTLAANSISLNGSLSFNGGDGTTITGAQAADIIRNLKIELSGNTYTLSKIVCGGGEWEVVGSFSRATTLSGAWSGATFTVTATPQGDTKATTITLSGGTGSVSNPDYTANSFISHKAYVNVNGSQTSGTATVKKILIDATSEYDSVTAATPERQSGSTFSSNKKTVYFNVRSVTSSGKVSGWTQVSADVTESYNAGQNSITDFSIWKGNDNVSGSTLNISPTGSVTLQEWHKKDGTWVGGPTTTVSGNASFYGNTTLYYKNLGNNQYYSAGTHNWYYT